MRSFGDPEFRSRMSTGNIKADNKSQMSKTFPGGWARGKSQDLNHMEKEFRE